MKITPTPQCRALEELLPLLDRPDMPAAQSAEMHAHLESCASCQAQHAAYLRLDAAAHRLLSPPATPIAQTEDILRDLLRADTAETPRAVPPEGVLPASPPGHPSQPGQARRFLSGLASLAAVLVIALLVTALLLNHARPGTPGVGAKATSSPPAATGAAGQLMDIAMVSPTEGWAVGTTTVCANSSCSEKPLLMHYLNGKWSPITLPFSGGLSNLSMISATDGWASGGELLLRYDGHTWKQQPNPNHLLFMRLQMFSDTAGYALALNQSTDKTEVNFSLYLYDGQSWTLQPPPENILATDNGHWSSFVWSNFSMISPTEGWASGMLQRLNTTADPISESLSTVILHYVSGQWTLQDIIPDAQINSISMTSVTDGWAAGNTLLQKGTGKSATYQPTTLLLHYTQGQWVQAADTIASPFCCPSQIVMLSASNGWILATSDNLLHYTGSHWSVVSLPTSGDTAGRLISALAMVSDNEGWAVGVQKNLKAQTAQDSAFNLVILHYLNGTWSIAFG